ncbi:MAG: 3-oxoacyl-[acyl-carrier-protein] reductase [Opitutaceae bacterium]|nr:3-oxoacyl-[acyl-carrier-protein] reductase [Opitutaceae bacterium]|tara:strand:- start:2889 stop:3638 length:750 start_codon:yes stop_codon:yes gene_type:complete
MNLTFNDRVAVVTGAGRGIGRSIAESLAAEGAQVICVSKNPDSCGSAAQAIESTGGKAKALPVDVADAPAVSEACAQLIEEFGAVDILVNNAGITRDNLLLRMSEEDWHTVLNTNLSSCFYWTKGLVRPMTRNRWGRIINVSSVSGLTGNPGQVNYSSAKAGMIAFAKSLAKELASRSITSNVVAPGFIATDMTASFQDGDVAKQVLAHIPLKRFGDSTDIANAVTYLASEEANYITGQVFTVDGGMTI